MGRNKNNKNGSKQSNNNNNYNYSSLSTTTTTSNKQPVVSTKNNECQYSVQKVVVDDGHNNNKNTSEQQSNGNSVQSSADTTSVSTSSISSSTRTSSSQESSSNNVPPNSSPSTTSSSVVPSSTATTAVAVNVIEQKIWEELAKLPTILSGLERGAMELENVFKVKKENEVLKNTNMEQLKKIEESEVKIKNLTESGIKQQDVIKQLVREKKMEEIENQKLKQEVSLLKIKLESAEKLTETLTLALQHSQSQELEHAKKISELEMQITSMKNRMEFKVSDSGTDKIIGEMKEIALNSNQLIFDTVINTFENDDEDAKWFAKNLPLIVNRSCQLSDDEMREAVKQACFAKAWKELSGKMESRIPTVFERLKDDSEFKSTVMKVVNAGCKIEEFCEKSNLPRFKLDWTAPTNKVCVAPAVVIDVGDSSGSSSSDDVKEVIVIVDGQFVDEDNLSNQ